MEPVQELDIVKQFPQEFKGLGKLNGSYTIKLKENAIPFAQTTPRRVPIPLLPKVKEELQRMEKMGVITSIEEMCNGMVRRHGRCTEAIREYTERHFAV